MNEDIIAEIIRQRNASSTASVNLVPKKKATVKKPVAKQIVTKESVDLPEMTEIQNILELIDIRKIVLDLIREELDRLKITKKGICHCPADKDNRDDDPMDIDLTRVERTRDLATVEGKINGIPISVILDSTSNMDLMPKFIAEKVGLEIDENVSYNIRGVSGERKCSGLSKATISLAPGCDIKTESIITEDYDVPEIILGRSTLKRYNYDLFESREHAIITCDGKNFFIPIVPDINRKIKD